MLDCKLLLLNPYKINLVQEGKTLDKSQTEYKRKYETLVETMGHGFFALLADGTIVDVNPAALEILGVDRNQFLERKNISTAWKIINDDGADILPEQFPSMVALRTGLPVRDTVIGVYNPKKESFIWLIINAIPIFREEEITPSQVYITFQDITERKAMEENYRRLARLTSDYVHCCTRTGKSEFQIQWVDGAINAVSGYNIEDLLTLGCFLPMVHPDDRHRISDYLLSLVPGDNKSIEFRIVTQQKEIRWVSEKSQCNAGFFEGELILLGAVTDITERKQAEDELQKSNKRFQEITAHSPLPMVITDAKGDIEFFNNKFIEVFGYTLDDISTAEQWWLAAYPNNVYRQEVQESWTKAIDKALEKGTQIETLEWDITCKNGAVRCVEFDMMPLGDISVIVMNDITERKKAEALIKESNDELDAFVHTVAHDLRTPLTPIMGYAEILSEEYNEQLDEQGLSYLAEIEKAGRRMLALMEGLLSLAKSGTIKRPIKFVPTDKVVARVIKNLEPNIAATGAILRINPLPPIHVPKTFLAQIFDNLIGNALRYAGNSGGLIEVGGEQAGKQIRFFVRDHGLGISEQERKHIFEIFYRGTNKGKVKGSGIGLAIVYKIARNYGGRAWVEETHGGGCTFWVEMEDASGP